MLKRRVILILVLLASAVFPCLALPSDAELTRLMVGAWRSPRHDYIYFADGTWWMGRPEPGVTHGTWRIERGALIEATTFIGEQLAQPRLKPPMRIERLDEHEIVYGGIYHMKRIDMREVDAD